MKRNDLSASCICIQSSKLEWELIGGLCLFCIMMANVKNLKKPSLCSSIFLMTYSGFRIIIEFFKQSQGKIMGIEAGQFLCLIQFFLGLFLYIKNKTQA